jgi:stage V sporulation protein S
MDRFYSNLDLREIKVGPDSSFPPDSDGQASATEDDAAAAAHVAAPPEPPPSAPGHEVLKVSAKSRPSAVAGAIAGVVREVRRAEVQAIGAGATNQAVKAIAIARDYLAEDEIDIICIPEFIDVIIENEERTAIRFIVEPR